jgi:hypothetical protein
MPPCFACDGPRHNAGRQSPIVHNKENALDNLIDQQARSNADSVRPLTIVDISIGVRKFYKNL